MGEAFEAELILVSSLPSRLPIGLLVSPALKPLNVAGTKIEDAAALTDDEFSAAAIVPGSVHHPGWHVFFSVVMM